MRICAYAEALWKTKSVCAIVGKKTRSKIEQNLGRKRAKTVYILNKKSKKYIKNDISMKQTCKYKNTNTQIHKYSM